MIKMNQIVECIPNFSEARRPEVVQQIVSAAASVGVRILDCSSDMDHNRTVLTFAGTPAKVEEAAFQAIKIASELIDMNFHTGEHPRIGATDVVPFVPITGVEMSECVEMAKRLGQRVGLELAIPIYLYEAAASRPERTNLEVIRKGQYEGLKKDILVNAERKPDFGPSVLGKAGATVIGARAPLIAFNVYLTSEDVSIAKAISKTVRQSSGGFRFVKAAGFLVEGRAQVSMNLTDYHQTPIARVVETIRREAQRYGVGIHHSELIGLIPQDALIDASVWYTQLDQFKPGQVLETRLSSDTFGGEQSSQSGNESSLDFLAQLAAPVAAPGGGSAAAYAGAMGAALVSMVAGLTIGKKKYSNVEPRVKEILAEAEDLRASLTADVVRDAAVFEKVMQAFKLPKETSQEQQTRNGLVDEATLEAAHVPLDVARKACRVIELASEIVAIGNLNAISDGISGAAMARAALTAAGTNVRINVNSLSEKQPGERLIAELSQLEEGALVIEADIRNNLVLRAGFSI
jgi:glutamate formiminotransferase/formiminotetrahydrofolate cyclodeaminase